METQDLLNERRKSHGSFNDNSRITQCLKKVIEDEEYARIKRHQALLSETQREALSMILLKIGRIIAGDASFQEHWDDIAGYAKLANGVDK